MADYENALRSPRNTPMYNLTCRNLAGIASIWSDHPDYAAAVQP